MTLRYAIAGIFNTLFGYSAFILFHLIFGLRPSIANFASYILALLLAYQLNVRYVFRLQQTGLLNFGKFITAFAFAYVLNLASLEISITQFAIRPIFGQVIAMIIFTLVFFLANRFLVFREPK